MKVVLTFCLIAVASVVAGIIWDILIWRFHFPYLPLLWLVRLLHADGESAYTTMMYGMMMFFFAVFSSIWVAWKWWAAR